VAPRHGSRRRAPIRDLFEAPATVELTVAEGIVTADEMAAVSTAWRRWGAHPSAVHTGYWFEAVARKPG
jgi:hypothetical protein